MIKRSFLMALLLALVIFTYGIAQADLIDGLGSNPSTSPTRVYVNPGGLGDALVYGYYNVKEGNINFFRVVNTSESTGVAVKIRFREGKESAEVLDYFICLSAADQYSGWIVGNAITSQPGQVLSWDNDTPTFPSLAYLGTFPFAYLDPYANVTAEMTKEGYFEILGIDAWPDTPGSRNVATSEECLWVATAGQLGTKPTGVERSDLEDVPNGLMGEQYLFDIKSATHIDTYAYNATALAYCRIDPVTNGGLSADDHPRLDDCQALTATAGLAEVNFALTKSNLYAMYDVEAILGGQTTYVITFPTKRLSVIDLGSGEPFDAIDSCETIKLTVWDDAEHKPQTQIGVSPPRQGTVDEVCDEVNVVVVGDSALPLLPTTISSSGGLLQFNIKVESAGFELGWIKIDLTAGNKSTTIGSLMANGLPAIGYEMQDFSIGVVTPAIDMTPAMLPMKYDVQVE